MRSLKIHSGIALAAGLFAPLAPVHAADEAAAPPEESSYVIGASLIAAPEYAGSDRHELKLRPLWAYQYGRFKISTSRASSVLGFAADAAGPGASAELAASNNWRFGAALRFDSGRGASDSPHLAGMPDIRRTLRGRFYGSYKLGEQWSLSASVSQDLIGRGGGGLANLDLGHRLRLGERTELSSGIGLSFGNARYMNTYFGVPQSATRADRPEYTPGAGVRDLHLGIGVMTALTPRWVAYANVGASRLLSGAADSPLTLQATSTAASIGLAYRCCK